MSQLHNAVKEWYRFPDDSNVDLSEIYNITDDEFIKKLLRWPETTRRNVLKSGRCRWITFRNSWPHGNSELGMNLVEMGFYYQNNTDLVNCAFCEFEMDGKTINPEEQHRNESPSCVFHEGDDVSGNIRFDDWKPHEVSNQTNRSSYDAEQCTALPELSQMELYCLKNNPKYPTHQKLDTRLNTFQGVDWGQRPDYKKVCDAGFFWAQGQGTLDKTTCFCCDGSLEKWTPNDNPWVEHAKAYFNCAFLIHQMGKHFIECVRAAVSNATSAAKHYGYHNPPGRNCMKCGRPAKLYAQPCGHRILCERCAQDFPNPCPMENCGKVIDRVMSFSAPNDN